MTSSDQLWRLWTAALGEAIVAPGDDDEWNEPPVPRIADDGGLTTHVVGDIDVRLSSRGVEALASAVETLRELLAPDVEVSPYELEDVLLRRLAYIAAGKEARLTDVTALLGHVREATEKSLVAVAVGGIFNSAVDADGAVVPLKIADRVIAGHLDDSYATELSKHARDLGLVGFRFDEVWWTADYWASINDPDVIPEILEDYNEQGTWPWMIIAVPVRGIGYPAVYAAVYHVEAILGALLALDAHPARAGGRAVPWVGGQTTVADNPLVPVLGDSPKSQIAVQVIDTNAHARLYTLDKADVPSGFHLGLDIDINSAMNSPGRYLLEMIAASTSPEPGDSSGWRLASACRQLWKAIGSNSLDSTIREAWLGLRHIDVAFSNASAARALMERYDSVGKILWSVDRHGIAAGDDSNLKELLPSIVEAYGDISRTILALEAGEIRPWSYNLAHCASKATALLHVACLASIPDTLIER
ncbi:hypothetical protein QQY66_27195 [Streptomyces sp. DG2A-72]|uniref:hypothetical protein n=1 Tax=Streptomyces sp. DG2A-72 TaxID=3051386 RepID=UPI00265BAD16|nr:hypothetical protein [Streptomyces sp. DG2A-72]MDO0935177.1 hypothetical protein [Streptomyces sp. DG2A-72]